MQLSQREHFASTPYSLAPTKTFAFVKYLVRDDFEVIIRSIREQLLVLPGETAVHTGHESSTLIGTDARDLDTWIARGW